MKVKNRHRVNPKGVYPGEWVVCPGCHLEAEVLRKTYLGQDLTGVELELRCGHQVVGWY